MVQQPLSSALHPTFDCVIVIGLKGDFGDPLKNFAPLIVFQLLPEPLRTGIKLLHLLLQHLLHFGLSFIQPLARHGVHRALAVASSDFASFLKPSNIGKHYGHLSWIEGSSQCPHKRVLVQDFDVSCEKGQDASICQDNSLLKLAQGIAFRNTIWPDLDIKALVYPAAVD